MQPEPANNQPKWLNPQLPREGRYVLGPLLGKGGMGEVVEAWDVVLCRTVALKALRNMDPAAMIRFMHEAQIQARVVHPNICRIYDIESGEGTLKIAMQLIKGPNLEQAAKQLSVDEVVGILCQMAEAVHAAHRVNLIHRDLKPSNIILERAPDGRWIPYLCDFGLAVSVGEPVLTLSHLAVGTPAFMAPEQSQGDRGLISPATDVYALGGTLHYAILGYPPGQLGSSPHQRRGPKPGLPRDLDTIIRKCLEPDPERRYPTAAALAEDLWRFRSGEPIQARPRHPGMRIPWNLPRRGRRLVVAASTCALACVGLAGYLAAALWSHTRDEPLAQRFLLGTETAYSDYVMEQVLPVHDMRPSQARVRTWMASLGEDMLKGGRDARGAGHYDLGLCHLLLGEFTEASRDLDQAGALGFQKNNLAELRARALVGAACWNPDGPHGPESPLPLFPRQEPMEKDLFQAALAHFARKEFAQAALCARQIGEGHPFAFEPAGLESAALCALARQRYQAGDMAGARAHYTEARDSALKRLEIWRSNESLHHAFLRASLGLAEVQMEQGAQALPLLQDLLGRCEVALRLNADSPAFWEDSLATRFLLATCQAEQGGNARATLAEAIAFMGLRMKEPSTPGLRAVRMLLHWKWAQWHLEHGQDPGPDLVEALRNSEATPFFNRDYLGEVLNFKAQVEASRGQDPRPTLDNALERIRPQLQAGAGWAPLETAARTWLLRARWERSQALDDTPSLASAHALADQALRIHPGAPGASALRAGALAMENEPSPGRRPSSQLGQS